MEPTIILATIQAGVRLGRKMNDVLVDETKERALVLPLGNLYGDVRENDALDYFRDHPELVADGGPYAGLDRPEKVKAYRTILGLNARLDDIDGVTGETLEIVANLGKFKQLKDGYGARPALQRVLGEVVEMAIDYFATQPELLAGDTNSKKILAAFLVNLDDVAFSEGTPRAIVSDVLLSSLKTLDANIGLVDDDLRMQTLLGGVTKSLIADHDALTSQGDKLRREDLIKRVASSIIKGGATAFSQHTDIFLRKDSTAEKMVSTTLSQVMKGIAGKEDLFTNEAVELLFNSALQAAAANAESFSDQEFIQEFISKTLNILCRQQGKEIFSEDTVAAILQVALETVSDHADTLIDVDNPQKQLLANTLSIITTSLTADVGGSRKIRDLFTKKQVTTLTRIVFEEVAKHPDQLLGSGQTDSRKTALAQIISSVSQAIAAAPNQLLTNDGIITLMEQAIKVTAQNSDKLLDLDTSDVQQNILYRAINQTVTVLLAGSDQRGLVTAEVFQEIMHRILPLVSANVEALIPPEAKQIASTVQQALTLADGVLENRINGANLPALIEGLLLPALWDELDPQDSAAVEAAARLILRAAA